MQVKRRYEQIGCILRHEGLSKTIVGGYLERKRYRGRPRMIYVQLIINDMGCGDNNGLRSNKGESIMDHALKSCSKQTLGLNTKEELLLLNAGVINNPTVDQILNNSEPAERLVILKRVPEKIKE